MIGRPAYRSPAGEAEMMGLYDEALVRLGAGCESRTIGTRFGGTHVLVTGPEDAPPLVVLPGGNFLAAGRVSPEARLPGGPRLGPDAATSLRGGPSPASTTVWKPS